MNFKKFIEYDPMPKSMQKNKYLFIGSMVFLAVVNFVIFYCAVNVNSIMLAFKEFIGYSETGKELYRFSWHNFEILFKQLRDPASDILPALKNTVIFFVSNTLVMLPLCYFVSYFLYKKIFGFRVFRVVFFIPSILSAVVLVTVFKEMIKTDGPLSKMLLIFGYKMPSLLTNPLTAKWVIVAYTMWTGFGVNVILYQGAMSRIPDSVIEAGELDGVTGFGELFRIITPMMWPTLSTTIILSLTGIFTASGPILLFTEGKYDTYTISYWIYSQVTFSKSYEYPSATGLFFTAIGLPIVLTVRYFINKVYDDVEY
ncbi:MAG: sugar ABC transporter permease [Clostridia bacterium]|nr:sugar ABC transporter permease [Clostridia bacterium]MDY2900682.1 sugar ABC transporter permease [Christensenellaceae bacterium]